MAAARPFADTEQLTATAARIWRGLAPSDWLEAFAAHPKIGASSSGGWASAEQAGTAAASQTVRERLAEANQHYEARFGYIFIVCASGRTAEAMLTDLERRLSHDADEELAIAADEQRQITELRLIKLLEGQ